METTTARASCCTAYTHPAPSHPPFNAGVHRHRRPQATRCPSWSSAANGTPLAAGSSARMADLQSRMSDRQVWARTQVAPFSDAPGLPTKSCTAFTRRPALTSGGGVQWCSTRRRVLLHLSISTLFSSSSCWQCADHPSPRRIHHRSRERRGLFILRA